MSLSFGQTCVRQLGFAFGYFVLKYISAGSQFGILLNLIIMYCQYDFLANYRFKDCSQLQSNKFKFKWFSIMCCGWFHAFLHQCMLLEQIDFDTTLSGVAEVFIHGALDLTIFWVAYDIGGTKYTINKGYKNKYDETDRGHNNYILQKYKNILLYFGIFTVIASIIMAFTGYYTKSIKGIIAIGGSIAAGYQMVLFWNEIVNVKKITDIEILLFMAFFAFIGICGAFPFMDCSNLDCLAVAEIVPFKEAYKTSIGEYSFLVMTLYPLNKWMS